MMEIEYSDIDFYTSLTKQKTTSLHLINNEVKREWQLFGEFVM